jgi:hypothetical protein
MNMTDTSSEKPPRRQVKLRWEAFIILNCMWVGALLFGVPILGAIDNGKLGSPPEVLFSALKAGFVGALVGMVFGAILAGLAKLKDRWDKFTF